MSGLFTSPRSLAKENQEGFVRQSGKRRRKAGFWLVVFHTALLIAILSLVAVIASIIDGAFGYVALRYEINPESLALNHVNYKDLDKNGLIDLLFLQAKAFAEDPNTGISQRRLDALAFDLAIQDRTQQDLIDLLETELLNPAIEKSWTLWTSLFDQKQIDDWLATQELGLVIEFRSWLNLDFLAGSQSPNLYDNGIRNSIFGSLLVVLLTFLISFPLGIGAAVYLEEFSNPRNWFSRLVQINIYNLAGIPSIIYGLIGLAVFVRSMDGLTHGRSILSASLTLSLLVLPMLIINSQEALRAVPKSTRDASFALGASVWQTVWHHVLPMAMDRIVTGTMIAVSRALGETAPLLVLGAASFLQDDLASVFSRFSALPIQIYQHISRPQAGYRNSAAAAIIVLLVLIFVLNASAILMRKRNKKARSD